MVESVELNPTYQKAFTFFKYLMDSGTVIEVMWVPEFETEPAHIKVDKAYKNGPNNPIVRSMEISRLEFDTLNDIIFKQIEKSVMGSPLYRAGLVMKDIAAQFPVSPRSLQSK